MGRPNMKGGHPHKVLWGTLKMPTKRWLGYGMIEGNHERVIYVEYGVPPQYGV